MCDVPGAKRIRGIRKEKWSVVSNKMKTDCPLYLVAINHSRLPKNGYV